MKILEFRAERFKRLSVVQITPEGHLVQITGKNGNGKTSVLDAIEAALGGANSVPAKPITTGKDKGRTVVTLGGADGAQYIVERRFTEANQKGYLSITAPDGAQYKKDPQKMLNEMLGAIGFDPLEFLRLKPAEQAAMLRSVVKMEVDIDALDKERAKAFEDRTFTNRQLAAAQARADSIIVPENLPDEAPDVTALVQELAEVGTYNADIDNQAAARVREDEALESAAADVASLEEKLERARAEAARLGGLIEAREPLPAKKDSAAIQQKISDARMVGEEIQRRDLLEAAQAEVTTFTRDSEGFTAAIAEIDKKKADALANAKMPIEGLSFQDGAVVFNGVPFEQASGAEQLRVSAAIGAALNPKLRVLLARDGSLLDSASLKALGDFAEANDMQIFLERVEESGEVGIVMEDGHVKGQETLVADFEKAEAGEAEKAPAAAAADETVDETKDPAYSEAKTFHDEKVAAIADMVSLAEIDVLNIKVKRSLKRFPGLTGTWNAAYLERVTKVKAMKTTKKD